jgi:hypothetical protein
LGERLLCKQEVIGSNPFTSTTVAATRHARRRRVAPLVLCAAAFGAARATPAARPPRSEKS